MDSLWRISVHAALCPASGIVSRRSPCRNPADSRQSSRRCPRHTRACCRQKHSQRGTRRCRRILRSHSYIPPHRYPVAGRRQGRRLSAPGSRSRAFSAWNRTLRPWFNRRRLIPAGAAAVVCTLRNAGIICMASLFFYFSYKYTLDLLYPYMLGDVKYFRENRSLIHIFQHAFIV